MIGAVFCFVERATIEFASLPFMGGSALSYRPNVIGLKAFIFSKENMPTFFVSIRQYPTTFYLNILITTSTALSNNEL